MKYNDVSSHSEPSINQSSFVSDKVSYSQ